MNIRRRQFIEIGLSGLASIAGTRVSKGVTKQNPLRRTRRLLVHNDGGKVKHMLTDNIQDVLSLRLGRIVGRQVDSYFYCGHDNMTQAFYNSEVPGIDVSEGASDTLRRILNRRKYDPNYKHIEFCGRHRIEFFWSFNMNDIQDHPFNRTTTLEERLAGLGRYKRDHRRWLLGDVNIDYPYQSVQKSIWSALNYEVPEIREFVYAGVDEVAKRYGLPTRSQPYVVDGLHFDYCRNASLFPPTFEQRPVEPKHLRMLTGLQR